MGEKMPGNISLIQKMKGVTIKENRELQII